MSKAEEIKKQCYFPESEKYATLSGGYVKDHEHYEFTPEELGELEAAIKSKTLQELKEWVIQITDEMYNDCADLDKIDRSEAEYDLHTIDILQSRLIETIEELQDE